MRNDHDFEARPSAPAEIVLCLPRRKTEDRKSRRASVSHTYRPSFEATRGDFEWQPSRRVDTVVINELDPKNFLCVPSMSF